MAGKQLNTKILAVRIIPNADPMLLKNLDVRPGDKSLGIFTTDCDDVSYTAVDEATKKADVHVAYAKSMYAGSGNASTALAGEFIGILSGPDPEEVRSGLQAAFSLIENDAHFYEANETGTVVYFAHCISRTGGSAGGNTDGVSDRTAVGSFRGTRCSVEGGGCGAFPLLRTAHGDKLCRRTSDGKSGILSGGMRCLCRCGLPDR